MVTDFKEPASLIIRPADIAIPVPTGVYNAPPASEQKMPAAHKRAWPKVEIMQTSLATSV